MPDPVLLLLLFLPSMLLGLSVGPDARMQAYGNWATLVALGTNTGSGLSFRWEHLLYPRMRSTLPTARDMVEP